MHTTARRLGTSIQEVVADEIVVVLFMKISRTPGEICGDKYPRSYQKRRVVQPTLPVCFVVQQAVAYQTFGTLIINDA